MRQYVIFIGCLIWALVLLASCSSKKNVTEQRVVYIHDTTHVKERCVDTIIKHEADTALAGLIAECDENNRVLVSQLEALQGQRVNIDPIIKYVPYIDEEGIKHTKAYIDILATTQAYEDKIYIYEREIEQLKTASKVMTEEYKKERSSTCINWLLTGFAIGLIVSMLLIYLLRKWLL